MPGISWIKALPYIGIILGVTVLVAFHNIQVSKARKAGDAAGYDRATVECQQAANAAQAEYDRKVEIFRASERDAWAQVEAEQELRATDRQKLEDDIAAERRAKQEAIRRAQTETLNTLADVGPASCSPDERLRDAYADALARAGSNSDRETNHYPARPDPFDSVPAPEPATPVRWRGRELDHGERDHVARSHSGMARLFIEPGALASVRSERDPRSLRQGRRS